MTIVWMAAFFLIAFVAVCLMDFVGEQLARVIRWTKQRRAAALDAGGKATE